MSERERDRQRERERERERERVRIALQSTKIRRKELFNIAVMSP